MIKLLFCEMHQLIDLYFLKLNFELKTIFDLSKFILFQSVQNTSVKHVLPYVSVKRVLVDSSRLISMFFTFENLRG
jgi:hypothetical protein